MYSLQAANNYASTLVILKRFEGVKALLRKTMPVARRVLGGNHDLTLTMRTNYARSLYLNDGATLDDLREAVTTLEEIEPIARRVFGSMHPFAVQVEGNLRNAQEALRAREAPPGES